MLRIFAFIIFIVAFGWIGRSLRTRKNSWTQIRQNTTDLLKSWKNVRKLNAADFQQTLLKSIYYLTFVCFVILALTGLIPFLLGLHLTGFTLLLHVALTPVFAICAVVVTLLRAHAHRFSAKDWEVLKLAVQKRTITEQKVPGSGLFFQKVLFWLCVLFTTILTTIVLSMYPISGTPFQAFSLDFHRFGAIMLTMGVAIYLFLSPRVEKEDEQR